MNISLGGGKMAGKKFNISLYEWCLQNNSSLIEEWDYSKNVDLNPKEIPPKYNGKAYWLCSKYKHSWKSVVSKRAEGTGCPYCSNRKVLAGFNDLATIDEELAKQWHPTMNGDLKPTDVTAGSHQKVVWKCSLDHIW